MNTSRMWTLVAVLAVLAAGLFAVSQSKRGSADTNETQPALSVECKNTVQLYTMAQDKVVTIEGHQSEIKGMLSQAATDPKFLMPSEVTRLEADSKKMDSDIADAQKTLKAQQSAYAACVKP